MNNKKIAKQLLILAKRIVLSFKYQITSQAIKDAKKQFFRELNAFEKSFIREVEEIGLEEFSSYLYKDGEYIDRIYKQVPSSKSEKYKKFVRKMRGWMGQHSRAVEKYFYDVLLGRHMEKVGWGKDRKDLDYYADKLQSSAWSLVVSLSGADLEYPKHNDFEKNVKYTFNKIRRKARQAFSDAIDFASYSDEREKEYDFAEVVNWDRFSFLPEGGISPDKMKKTIVVFSEAVKLIKRAGYSFVVKDRMNVSVFAKLSGQGAGATYDYRKDEINIYPLGSYGVETTIHEFGHRLYFHIMSGSDRNRWKALYDGDLLQVTNEDVNRVMDELPVLDEFLYIDRKMINESVDNYVKKWKNRDGLAEEKGEAFKRKIWVNSDYDRIRKGLESYLVGKPVMVNYISDYGNTDELEAFAELFRDIVLRKNVNPQAKAWFDMVVK